MKKVNIANGQYLVIEGNIGAGKTSLSQILAADLEAQLMLEQFADNPFLASFYEDPARHALAVELFFMTERHQQLQNFLANAQASTYRISDYIFAKTLLFASKTLEGEELQLFQRLFHSLNTSFPKPDLLVYLHRPVEELLFNIKRRNRSYEQDISPNYLEKIQAAYFDFFQQQATQIPILVLDVEGMDFVNNTKDYQQLLQILQAPYPKGIHHWSAATP